MLVFTDPASLLARIDTDAPGWRLVGIDGWPCAGKSTLAKELSRQGRLWSMDLDCFLIWGMDAFLDALNWPALAAAIEANEHRIVIAGVCVRAVLRRLDLGADKHVYVKRMSAGVWADEGDAIGSDLAEYAQAGFPASPLELEVRRYHEAFAPHLNADYDFHDLASDGSKCTASESR